MNVVTESSLTPEPWVVDASCAQSAPDVWFPEHGDKETARLARRICDTCPVKPACAEYAVRTHQRHGIWAGMNPKSLHRLRRNT